MKKNYYTAAFFFLLLTWSCKKDTPPFPATGYWKGNVYHYVSVMLNQSDGTTRLYMKIPGRTGTDTAAAFLKYDGSYTVSGNVFRGAYLVGGLDSIIIESTSLSSNVMSGRAFESGYDGESLPFEFTRQPGR
jgi:hypothetical protein